MRKKPKGEQELELEQQQQQVIPWPLADDKNKVAKIAWAVVVALLAERLLLTPEILGSNLGNGKNIIKLSIACYCQDINKLKKRTREARFFMLQYCNNMS